jgi:hypothetical protein
MAATWIRPLHMNKGKSIAKTLQIRTDYAKNPEKTEGGELVSSFECNSKTVDLEFALSKNEYAFLTGRESKKNDVIAYHIRQSFKPGEITPEEANEIGYELVKRFTKGKHAFIVATHTDKNHIHNHAIFNSTTLDCKAKFKNFWGTTFAIRKLSDLLCAEHGLSVIENPQPSPGRDYHKWLGEDKPLSQREILRNKIDEILPNCKTFEDFLSALRAAGYIVNDTRKYITVKLDGAKKAIRLKSLGEKYTEEAIKERLGLTKFVGSSGGEITKISLLIDIQNRIRESRGYAHWAKIFNLKEAAKTLIFLQENGIGTLEELTDKASAASTDFNALSGKIKDADKRLKDTNTMQKYISQYGKTRDVFAEYKASGWSRKFYAEHTADILLHRAAKKFFDNQNLDKLPKMADLKQTFAEVLAEKKTLYSDYRPLKERSHALQVALYNVRRILGVQPDEKTRENTRENSPVK